MHFRSNDFFSNQNVLAFGLLFFCIWLKNKLIKYLFIYTSSWARWSYLQLDCEVLILYILVAIFHKTCLINYIYFWSKQRLHILVRVWLTQLPSSRVNLTAFSDYKNGLTCFQSYILTVDMLHLHVSSSKMIMLKVYVSGLSSEANVKD